MKKNITIAKLSNVIERDWITRAYTGLEEGCRCGCHGNYFNAGTKGFTRAVNKAFKLDPVVHLTDDNDTVNALATEIRKKVWSDPSCKAEGFAISKNGKIEWLDIVLENGKTITFYFD